MTLTKVKRLTLRDAVRSRDEMFPGSWLYPSDQRIEGLPLCQVPSTCYVIHTKYVGEGVPAAPFLMQMLTTDSVGLRHGWDTCGGCDQYMTRCTCRAGITPPKYLLRDVPAVAVVEPKPELAEPVLDEVHEPVTSLAGLDEAASTSAQSMLSRLRKKLAS